MAIAPCSPETQAEIRRLLAADVSVSETARRCGVSRDTVYKYGFPSADPATEPPAAGLPAAKHETPPAPPAVSLPDPESADYSPYPIDAAGAWGVLCDVHLPWHDRATIEAAVREFRRRGVKGVILNGDTLDSHEISRHDKDPTAPRYVAEIETGRKLFAWLRDQLPHARLVMKAGNHEERLEAYVVQRAPALFGLDGLDLPSLLKLADVGCEWVADRRVIAMGHLNVIHGHEYPGGVFSPVNPARGLYLKARSRALCGHHHQTSEHHARDIRGRPEAAWSVGCACYLHPRYAPLNNWNHGFAAVELASDGTFSVSNLRVMSGKVV